ncbi:Uncharacterized protein conserved in bacteria [Niallia circulans]|uniref:HNH endonuclease n=1 Tax=Niallia circulans TaxID=1397 RepID=UPI00069F4FAF|nr:HNH endonuclease [Niallia circulans]MDR4317864.1 HNH endonuclease [Niallia circulans]MED3841650.1 HNH endonuclease [Niallia circulans]MED4243386.1 HNH endonuclease [Niallia circulans]MED4248309.1 HNH endonuclease [Niallia circulans]QKH62354.1 HNH endonuclease [Niallia circulans]
MNGHYRKQFHEWATKLSLNEVLEACEICEKGIECVYCDTNIDVYCVYWKKQTDYYCINCLKEFLNNELSHVSTGLLRKRFLIFSRDNFRCVYCGRNPREHDTTLEIEHIVPRAKGGSDGIANLVTACKECNAGKGDYLLNKRQKEIILNKRV